MTQIFEENTHVLFGKFLRTSEDTETFIDGEMMKIQMKIEMKFQLVCYFHHHRSSEVSYAYAYKSSVADLFVIFAQLGCVVRGSLAQIKMTDQ